MAKEKYQNCFEKVRNANMSKQLKKDSFSSLMISVFLFGMLTSDSINKVFVNNKKVRNIFCFIA